ncbi:hypothetical protein BU24DRAFT_423800 [Aaosphaeria arxii CBS 175.79]|uniref:F-box domain-containing protein n=1 Tax=Aaosphaeria arxii CBS 175.79 TaxID=1450172 RepID=A0A6A5XQ93_9PLEO|nr:uncharacterized protein BU24DRAFT_423800 [Aaosphaeria arxii CBS 175.79]KAF2014900.1 hypothetical protein BU24DRAFT_423800 [Aaosphaeria arxii CBS 175.79]
MPQSNPSHLTSLSTELLWRIVEALPLSLHFDFAYTCKFITEGCSKVLQKYWQWVGEGRFWFH